jgi:hypothetical protein
MSMLTAVGGGASLLLLLIPRKVRHVLYTHRLIKYERYIIREDLSVTSVGYIVLMCKIESVLYYVQYIIQEGCMNLTCVIESPVGYNLYSRYAF